MFTNLQIISTGYFDGNQRNKVPRWVGTYPSMQAKNNEYPFVPKKKARQFFIQHTILSLLKHTVFPRRSFGWLLLVRCLFFQWREHEVAREYCFSICPYNDCVSETKYFEARFLCWGEFKRTFLLFENVAWRLELRYENM